MLYLFIFFLFQCSVASIPLPKDIINTISAMVSVTVVKEVFLNVHRDFREDLFFPSTDAVKFIKSNTGGYTQEELLTINNDSTILPDFQLWQCSDSSTRMDKDTVAIKTTWRSFNFKDAVLVFDAYKTPSKKLYAVVLCNNHISFRCLTNPDQQMRLLNSPFVFLQKPSLCFHHQQEATEISFIRDEAIEKSFISYLRKKKRLLEIFSFIEDDIKNITTNSCDDTKKQWRMEQKQYCFLNSFVFKTIMKHEYIGARTFLIVADNQLFFGVIENDEKVHCTKQTIFIFDEKIKKEVSIVSVAANQDQDKKTKAGRARFFTILTACGRVLLADLLLDTIVRSLCSFKPRYPYVNSNESVFYDSISFHDNIISCWNVKGKVAAEITINSCDIAPQYFLNLISKAESTAEVNELQYLNLRKTEKNIFVFVKNFFLKAFGALKSYPVSISLVGCVGLILYYKSMFLNVLKNHFLMV